MAVGAVAGAALAAAPTGVTAIDVVWCAAFAASLTYCGGWTPRTVMLPVAGVAVVLADSRVALGLAGAALAFAVANAARIRFSTRYGMAVGGFLALSLLTGSGPEDHLLAAASTTAVTLVVLVTALAKMTSRRRRVAVRLAASVAGLVVVCGAAGVVAGLMARPHVDTGTDAFRAARSTGENGDLQAALASFSQAERAFRNASSPLDSFGQLGRLVPVLSQHLAVATTAVDAAGDAAEAGRRAGGSIDLDTIAVQDGGIDLAALSATEPALHQLVDSVGGAIARLQAVPRDLLVAPVSDALDDALRDAARAGTTADRLHRAVLAAPELLGGNGPRRYLVLFTSPDEIRGRLGFPGAYAVLRFDDGRVTFEKSGDVARLDVAQRIDPNAIDVPARMAPYLPYDVTKLWRSVTSAPDAPSVAAVARQFAASGPVGAVDGVVFADPHALAALVGLVGEIPLPVVGGSLTETNTVDFVNRRQYLEFPELGQALDRKDLLTDVAGLVGARLQHLSVPSIRDVTARFGPVVGAGHLMFTVDPLQAPDAAALLAETSVDGGFPRPGEAGSDILYVAQRNNGGFKIDLFLHRTLDYRVSVAPDGRVEATLTLQLENTAPASGLPEYLIGYQPGAGTNGSATLIYSRYQLDELTLDGAPVLAAVAFDGGLFVYQLQTDLGPGQTRTVVARFSGRSPADAASVVVYPGGLATPDAVSIHLDDARVGRPVDETLTVDRPACRRAGSGGPTCP